MLDKQQQELYQRICDYELDDSSHEFGFLAHLMRANGWSRPFALRAIEEYRKFVFLALVADHPVTPSDQVDQVWHLHLLCSDAYWNDFCPRVLGRPLHHHPAKGGQAERDRFHEQYRATIRSYRQHFGEPPADLWPPVDVRFGRDLQMQRGRIRRPFRSWRGWPAWRIQASTLLVYLALMACGMAKAAAGASYDPPPESGDLIGLLGKLLSLIAGFTISLRHLRPLLLQPSSLSSTPELDNEDLAYLSHGPSRVLDLGLASLVQQGVLRADSSTNTLVLMEQTDQAMPGIAKVVLTVYRQLASNGQTAVAYADIVKLSRYDFSSQRVFLRSHKLLLNGLADTLSKLNALTTPLLYLFVIETFLGTNVPSPLDFLLPYFLCNCIGIIHPNNRTLWGDSVLQHYQAASTHSDPLQRIALLGHVAMSDGRLDELNTIVHTSKQHGA